MTTWLNKLNKKYKDTSRELLVVMFLLSFCWSFYFYYEYSSGNLSLGVSGGNVQNGCNMGMPIYSVETEKKVVSLTFDSAWGIEDLDEILKILEKNNVKATFFVTGEFATRNKEAVKKMYDEGHEIGNHGENHKMMSTLSEEECASEIRMAENHIYEAIGKQTKWFRPPSGDYDKQVVNTAAAMGYYTIQWDCDSLDWKNYSVSDIVDRVVNHKNLRNGSIVLLHNGTKYTAKALGTLIDELRNKGYEFTTLEELVIKDEYEINVQGRQIPK